MHSQLLFVDILCFHIKSSPSSHYHFKLILQFYNFVSSSSVLLGVGLLYMDLWLKLSHLILSSFCPIFQGGLRIIGLAQVCLELVYRLQCLLHCALHLVHLGFQLPALLQIEVLFSLQ